MLCVIVESVASVIVWVDGLTLISRQYNGLDEDEVKDKVEDEDMPMVDSDRNCYDLLLSNI